jgi:hypothetical protein
MGMHYAYGMDAMDVALCYENIAQVVTKITHPGSRASHTTGMRNKGDY